MSVLVDFLIDILKLVAAGSIVFFIAWSVLKPEIEKQRNLKFFELKKSALDGTLPLRLQAYERLILFLERINPSNLLLRSHVAGISAAEMQHLLIAEIRSEFQHNITQQLYVSIPAWNVITRLKEDTITLINNTAKGLPADAGSVDLSKTILTHLAGMEQNPYDAALDLVKADIQQLF